MTDRAKNWYRARHDMYVSRNEILKKGFALFWSSGSPKSAKPSKIVITVEFSSFEELCRPREACGRSAEVIIWSGTFAPIIVPKGSTQGRLSWPLGWKNYFFGASQPSLHVMTRTYFPPSGGYAMSGDRDNNCFINLRQVLVGENNLIHMWSLWGGARHD